MIDQDARNTNYIEDVRTEKSVLRQFFQAVLVKTRP
jgi:hypothetical protein